jgi:hypothetical protein
VGGGGGGGGAPRKVGGRWVDTRETVDAVPGGNRGGRGKLGDWERHGVGWGKERERRGSKPGMGSGFRV